MNTKLNNYANIFTPVIQGTITTSQWLDQIKHSDYITKIEEARQYKKLYAATGNRVIQDEYNKIKTQLPAVTWNGTFTNKKSNANFVAGTGFIFFDIDHTDFNIETLDKSKIYAYHKSIGGLGYSLICKCDGINVDNYDSSFFSISKDLGITDYIDVDAKKVTQYSILSYDPGIFINDDSYLYNSVTSSPKSNSNNFVLTSTLVSKEEEHNAAVKTKSIVRYNNLNDFNFDGKDFIEKWENGLDYVFVSKPFQPLQDGRKRYMMNYIRNYVWLNPTLPYNQIINSAKFINLSVGIEWNCNIKVDI